MRIRPFTLSMGLLLTASGWSVAGSRVPTGPSAVPTVEAAGFQFRAALQCGGRVTVGRVTQLTVRDASSAVLYQGAGPSCGGHLATTDLSAPPVAWSAYVWLESAAGPPEGAVNCSLGGAIPIVQTCTIPLKPGDKAKLLTATFTIR